MGVGCRLSRARTHTHDTFYSLVNHNVGTNGDDGREMGEKG